jgi:hypothetical protein
MPAQAMTQQVQLLSDIGASDSICCCSVLSLKIEIMQYVSVSYEISILFDDDKLLADLVGPSYGIVG